MLRREFIWALDRPGGRRLLGALASWYVRRKDGTETAVYHDGERWVRATGGGRYSVDGVRFDYYRNTIADFAGEYDAWLRAAEDHWFHLYRPQPGDVVIDIGAGIGTDTLAFARAVGPTGRVLAVEAHPETYDRLRKNCAAHGFGHVTCVPAAIVDVPGTVYIGTGQQHESNHLLPRGAEPSAFPVRGVRLDDLCAERGIGRVDFLKMNIEGAERLAIRGMADVAERTQNICIAAHSFRAARGDGEFFDTRRSVVEFLRVAGFSIHTRDHDPRPYARDHIHGVREPS